MECNTVTIIGAGCTGRGFIARLLNSPSTRIIFIDQSKTLVDQLNAHKRYSIYVGSARQEHVISGYQAYQIEDPAALSSVDSDYFFVSVGEQNLPSLAGFFDQLCALPSPKKLRVVLCENGISPKNVLQKSLSEKTSKRIEITQGAIFCTTIPENNHSLDILSEDYSEISYDVDDNLFTLPYPNFNPKRNFDSLLERKIYTYNCLSACIAYTGYMRGYDIYSAAANDAEVKKLYTQLSQVLNTSLSKYFNIPLAEQEAFAKQAIQKFQNPLIADTIYKNARDAIRKISPSERLMGPLRIVLEQKGNIEILSYIIACALIYIEREENTTYKGVEYPDAFRLFLELNGLKANDEAATRIFSYYSKENNKYGS